jgi:hypothetical protein
VVLAAVLGRTGRGRGRAIGACFLLIYPGIVKGIPPPIDASGASLLVLGGADRRGRRGRVRDAPRMGPGAPGDPLRGSCPRRLLDLRPGAPPQRHRPAHRHRRSGDDGGAGLVPEPRAVRLAPLLTGHTFKDETARVSRQGETVLFPRRHSTTPSNP